MTEGTMRRRGAVSRIAGHGVAAMAIGVMMVSGCGDSVAQNAQNAPPAGGTGRTEATAGGDVAIGPPRTGLSKVDVAFRMVPGALGQMPALVYRPDGEDRPLPVVILLHAADSVTGLRPEIERSARELAHEGRVSVVAVQLRSGLDSVAAGRAGRSAYLWARGNASSIAGDPNRVAVVADTGLVAGAALAAVRTEQQPADTLLTLQPSPGSSATTAAAALRTLFRRSR